MNLIVNRQLNYTQKQLIYELTLKKRQSKKSTMSEKHVAARKQLALELMQESVEYSPTVDFEASEIQARKKEANIKFNKTRLEHLNGELERRLQQYEYLVAQEKALLGSCNMMLFTNEGVNNFHLYDALSTPSRRIRTFQQQQKNNNSSAHRNSSAASSTSSTSSATLESFSASSSSGQSQQSGSNVITTTNPASSANEASSKRPPLNSSASTVSNLNALHMLPSLAGPRRSASSVTLMTINHAK